VKRGKTIGTIEIQLSIGSLHQRMHGSNSGVFIRHYRVDLTLGVVHDSIQLAANHKVRLAELKNKIEIELATK